MTIKMIQEIRQVSGGFIVEARWPVGPDPSGYGEVICKTLEEVFDIVRRTAAPEQP